MEQIPEEIDAFTTWLMARGPLRGVVEIGVRRGGTSALWCILGATRVVGIDWTGKDSLGAREQAEVMGALSDMYPGKFYGVLGDSQDSNTAALVRRAFDDGPPIDLLFIDGDHSYDGAYLDWRVYRRLVRPGGVVAFHDIVDTPEMRGWGHGVYRLWGEIRSDIPLLEAHEFVKGGSPWGGIGAVVVPPGGFS